MALVEKLPSMFRRQIQGPVAAIKPGPDVNGFEREVRKRNGLFNEGRHVLVGTGTEDGTLSGDEQCPELQIGQA